MTTIASSSTSDDDSGGESVTIAPEQLGEVFPFFLAVSPDQRIAQVGPACARLGLCAPGELFADCFQIAGGPAGTPATARVDGQGHVVLHAIRSGLRLSGQFVRSSRPGMVLFLGLPASTDAADLSVHRLSLSDFPAHSSRAELLIALSATRESLARSQEFTRRLSEQAALLSRANRELDDARKRLEHLLASGPIVLFTARPADLSLTYVSSNMFDHFGYPPETLMAPGFELKDMVHPEDRPRLDARIGELADRGRSEVTFRFRRPDHSWCWVEERLELGSPESRHSAPRGEPGEPARSLARTGSIAADQVSVIGSWLDMSARVEAENLRAEGEDQLRRIVESSLDGVVVIDSTGTILDWSKQAEHITGYSREEVKGRELAEVIVPHRLRESHRKGLLRQQAAGERKVVGQRLLLPVLSRQGEEIPVQLTVTTWSRRGSTVFCGFLRDDRERRAVEDALRREKEAAQSVAESKALFLAHVSHEFRTPLNAILGMTGLAVDACSQSRVRECLATVRSAGESLLDLVNDILDYSKIEAARLELEPQDFRADAIVEETVEMLAHAALEKGLKIAVYVDPRFERPVHGDPGRVRQVLVNLIANAVKFTDVGWVTCEAELVDADEPTARFSISDSGIGIESPAHADLFEPFSQIKHVEARNRGGTGLGLAISYQLARMMGGSIEVQSELGRGSRFTFTARLGAPRGNSPETATRRPLEDTAVLLAMPDAPARALVARQLSDWGAAVRLPGEAHPAIEGSRPRQIALVAEGQDVTGPAHTNGARVIALGANALSRPSRLLEQLLDDAKPPRHLPGPGWGVGALRPAVRPGARILVVEDNVVNQRTVVWLLERWGLRADVAADGIEALEALRRAPYDIVLMDCRMPRMEGVEATLEIRREEAGTGRRTPIVALTANAFSSDRERCLAAGMDDYLTKPLMPETLAATLARFLPAAEPGVQAALPERARSSLSEAPSSCAKPDALPGDATASLCSGSATCQSALLCNTEARPPAAPGAVPEGIDYPAILHRMYLGSRENFLEIAVVFVSNAAQLEERLHVELAAGNRTGLARTAHQLAGSAGNVGAVAVGHVAREMEAFIRQAPESADLEELATRVAQITRLLDTFRTFLSGLTAGD